MSDETTFCPDCAIERGGFSTGTEKCLDHKIADTVGGQRDEIDRLRSTLVAAESERDAATKRAEEAERETEQARLDTDAMRVYGNEQRDRAIAAESERDALAARLEEATGVLRALSNEWGRVDTQARSEARAFLARLGPPKPAPEGEKP